MKIILIILLFLFSGCSEKLIFVKPPCEKIDTISQPIPRKIRIYIDDTELYYAYIREFRAKIDNENKLIIKHNEKCDD